MVWIKVFSLFSIIVGALTLSHASADHETFSQELKIDIPKTVYKKDIDERIDAYRLSMRGDFPVQVDENPIDTDNKRRLFYTTGDGDCFFWSVGVSRVEAMKLWLDNAADPVVRNLAYQEIYDEFLDSKLPYAIRQDEGYKVLRQEYDQAKAALQDRNNFNPRQDRLTILANVEEKIKEYAKSEDIYRAYVTHGLRTRSDFMLYPQEWPESKRFTYFIDVLAYLSKKNLTVWTYSDDGQYLIKAHSYHPTISDGTWETLHQGLHYSRVVLVSDHEKIQGAVDAETTALKKVLGIKDVELLKRQDTSLCKSESKTIPVAYHKIDKEKHPIELKFKNQIDLSTISLGNNSTVKPISQTKTESPLLKQTAIVNNKIRTSTSEKKHLATSKKVQVGSKNVQTVTRKVLINNKKILSDNKKIRTAISKIQSENKKILTSIRKILIANKKIQSENKKTQIVIPRILTEKKRILAANRKDIFAKKKVLVSNKRVLADNRKILMTHRKRNLNR